MILLCCCGVTSIQPCASGRSGTLLGGGRGGILPTPAAPPLVLACGAPSQTELIAVCVWGGTASLLLLLRDDDGEEEDDEDEVGGTLVLDVLVFLTAAKEDEAA